MCGLWIWILENPFGWARLRDNVEWQWIYAQRDIGEIALGNLMSQLGFQEANRHGKMMRSDEWPLQVVFAPLHTSQKALVGGYERLIREGILGDGLFDGLDMSTAGRRALEYCGSNVVGA